LRLLEQLLGGGHEVHLVVTDYGRRLLFDEAGVRELTPEQLVPALMRGRARAALPLIIHPNKDVGALIASGSFMHQGMVVLPCSSASLGAMATGSGNNLLCRAAAVALKERRPLIVCHREMPLSLIDIRNMETLALAGATLCSPNPGFYLMPKRVEDLVDFVVGKVLDHLGVEHSLQTRWEERVAGEGG
jgi:4-hydroxy-3-polyprenylbenzoate decarboxylase